MARATGLSHSYVIVRLIYLSLSLYACFRIMHSSNREISPAVLSFLGYLTSAFLVVGLQKGDYQLFLFISFAFIIFIVLFFKYRDYKNFKDCISNEYHTLFYAQAKSDFHLLNSPTMRVVVISLVILGFIYIFTSLSLNFSLTSNENDEISICGLLPQTKSITFFVSMNSIYSNFMSPPIALDSDRLPDGATIKFSPQVIKPTLNSTLFSNITINITDKVKISQFPIKIKAFWYVFGFPIEMNQYKIHMIKLDPLVILSPSPSNEAIAGSTIYWEVNVSTHRTLIYKFSKNEGRILNDTTNPTWQWKTNLSDAGENIINVYVEDINDSSWNRSANCTYKIINNFPPSVIIRREGYTNCFRAIGTDTEQDILEYKFEIKKLSGELVRYINWNSKNETVLNDLAKGEYKMTAFVKDKMHNWTNLTFILSFQISKSERNRGLTTSSKIEDKGASELEKQEETQFKLVEDKKPQSGLEEDKENQFKPEEPKDVPKYELKSSSTSQQPPDAIDRADSLIGGINSWIL